MNCAEFEEAVVELARGGAHDREAVAHVAACPPCAARLADEERLTAALRVLAAARRNAEAPPRVEAAVMAAFRARNHRAPVLERWASWAAVAAMLAVAALVQWAARPAARPAVAEPEIATRFFPVASGTDFGSIQAAGMVRVRVPRATLTWYGLPMDPDRAAEPVTADLLVDGRGMAQAIRFVH